MALLLWIPGRHRALQHLTRPARHPPTAAASTARHCYLCSTATPTRRSLCGRPRHPVLKSHRSAENARRCVCRSHCYLAYTFCWSGLQGPITCYFCASIQAGSDMVLRQEKQRLKERLRQENKLNEADLLGEHTLFTVCHWGEAPHKDHFVSVAQIFGAHFVAQLQEKKELLDSLIKLQAACKLLLVNYCCCWLICLHWNPNQVHFQSLFDNFPCGYLFSQAAAASLAATATACRCRSTQPGALWPPPRAT